MGWKCPVCLKDFKQDKKGRDNHVKSQHNGIAADIENLLLKSTKKQKQKQKQKGDL